MIATTRYVLLTLTALLVSAAAHAEDKSSETTDALNGTRITYEYSSGRAYDVKFEQAGVRYRYLSGSKPEKWWGPFPYQAMQVEEQQYFASWFEAAYGDYVTLLINFENRQLHGSAIIRGEEIHFHRARITEVEGR